MNHPTDAGIEQLFNRPLDLGSGSSFRASPELRELQERFLVAKGEKQNMTISAGCFAMACPIMPLGFLAIFSLLGKMDGLDKDPETLEMGRGLKGEMARIAAAEALMRKRKGEGEDVESNAYLRYASRELQMRPLRIAMKPLKGSGSEKRVIPRQQSREALSNGFFMTKEKQNKMRDIKQQKILLESLANKEREEQNHIESNAVAQKLEKLDQLLRKMGATD
jgi:hypothetical protein